MKYSTFKNKETTYITVYANKNFEVTLCNLGASIYSILFYGDNMTLTPDKKSEFEEDNKYYGKTIGRVTGRIKDGILKQNNRTYYLDKNEGNNTLHSGRDGLSSIIFDFSIIENKDCIEIIFTHLSKHLKERFPNDLLFEIRYVLNDVDDKLTIYQKCYNAKGNVVSLTNHSYFCLGENDLSSLTLLIPDGDYFVEVDPIDMIPLRKKEIIPCLDFKSEKIITQNINDSYLISSKTNGIDHFIYSDLSKNNLTLSSPKFRMVISSSYSGVQLYSYNYDDGVTFKEIVHKLHRGIAIEPQLDPLSNRICETDVYLNDITYSFKKLF